MYAQSMWERGNKSTGIKSTKEQAQPRKEKPAWEESRLCHQMRLLIFIFTQN